MDSSAIKSKLSRVVDLHVAHVGLSERDLITTYIASAVSRAALNEIGRGYQTKINEAADALVAAADSLGAALDAIVGLDTLAREALSRQIVGILAPDDFDPTGTAEAWLPLGYIGRVENFEKSLSDFTAQVAITGSLLSEKSIRYGRGAPPKDGARAVAHHCLIVYERHVGRPSHPSWNDYNSETYGGFYTFVKDVFEAVCLDASPEEMVKQAIKMAEKNK